jgi:hypothetical protein
MDRYQRVLANSLPIYFIFIFQLLKNKPAIQTGIPGQPLPLAATSFARYCRRPHTAESSSTLTQLGGSGT